jgi:hypothetical protein
VVMIICTLQDLGYDESDVTYTTFPRRRCSAACGKHVRTAKSGAGNGQEGEHGCV